MQVKQVSVLGATGSIGTQTLKVMAMHPDRFSVFALGANRSSDLLLQQCQQYQPKYAVLQDPSAASQLQLALKNKAIATEVLVGACGFDFISSTAEVDIVVAAIVGAAGLMPTYRALQAGKRVLIANKETLVIAGDLMLQALRKNKAMLLPIDSEHSAILQCLGENYQTGETPKDVSAIWLTASGGPFRDLSIAKFVDVTPKAACNHPNWVMGKKISVDSATMMNKGLEVIEAHFLFGLAANQINVVIHPQSIVHSCVEYCDGALLAQMGVPDMSVPIAYALSFPDRMVTPAAKFNLLKAKQLNFEPIDHKRYPCLDLAYRALEIGGAAPAILNAANEVAVAAFLSEKIRFPDIYAIVAKTLEGCHIDSAYNIEELLQIDKLARLFAEDCIVTC